MTTQISQIFKSQSNTTLNKAELPKRNKTICCSLFCCILQARCRSPCLYRHTRRQGLCRNLQPKARTTSGQTPRRGGETAVVGDCGAVLSVGVHNRVFSDEKSSPFA